MENKDLTIKEMQRISYELMEKINVKKNIIHEPDSIFLSLAEEVGEVARELSKKQKGWRGDFDKEKLGEELADVVSRAMMIASDNDIDLSGAMKKKIEKYKKRFELNGI
ncbi:MAG: MazG nucleotide pyrophosphohydrolase domain-containing protein [Nanoarchaeota archaeon]|nr:MazG nucleotide pyrophosphohydrolase domain-containing protein [Nanoarchaeota archaeon]